MPARCGGTTLTAVDASGAFTSPMPIPPTMKPASSVVQSELGVIPYMSSSATPTPRARRRAGSFTGIRTDRRPAIGATTNEISDSGRKRMPASIGERPRTFCRYSVR